MKARSLKIQNSALRIKSVKHLCRRLGTSRSELESLCGDIDRHVCSRTITRNGKKRRIDAPVGRFREILRRLNRILQRLSFPRNMHGGLRGRSTVSYASRHTGKSVLLQSDLKDFFPSIDCKRVYSLFNCGLECTPDVSRFLTRLTTFNGALPQGYPTSTVIGALVSRTLATRLDKLATDNGGTADIFVDDIVVSGPAYTGRLKRTVLKIVEQEGFKPNTDKTDVVDRNSEQVLTGVRVNHSLDVPSGKVAAIRELISDIKDRRLRGHLVSRKEERSARGKIRYVKRLNKGAGVFLERSLEAALNTNPVSVNDCHPR